MPLAPGTKLGSCEIIGLLGVGGMGEVYRARDSNLDRDVAIKVLPSLTSIGPERLRRFEQEARAAAALSHPNILSVFQLGSYEGVPYLVSEYLEGTTLRELLSRGSMPTRKAIDYGIQIAGGLAAAHERGITHRDLKPENLFITRDGRVKILDFGLAKLQQRDSQAENNSATATFSTEPGVVLGTVGYMSPEQVRGQHVDYRADIFAFGANLYEMLTGQRAFHKPTSAETMSAILKEEPPRPSQITPGISPALQRVLQRCLEKSPEQRFQSASDLAFALEALSDSGGTSAIVAGKPIAHRIWRLTVSGSIALVLAALGVTWWAARQRTNKLAPKQKQLTANSDESAVYTGKISPDGKYLAYLDLRGFHVQSLATGDVSTVPRPSGSESAGIGPWFRDSTRFYLVTTEPRPSSWVISILGQTARKAFDDCAVMAISPDGARIAGIKRESGAEEEVWLTGPNGERPERFLTTDSKTLLGPLRWSPDGNRIAYSLINTVTDRNKRQLTIESRDLHGQSPSTILFNPDLPDFYISQGFEWLSDGRIVYSLFDREQASDNLWELDVDLQTGKPRGQPRRLTTWPGFHLDSLSATTDHRNLVYRRWAQQSSVYVVDFDRNTMATSHPRRLTLGGSNNWPMGWTADGKAIVLMAERSGHWSVSKQNLNSDLAEVIVSGKEGAEVDSPRVSSDGSWILYLEVPSQGWNAAPARLMRAPVEGGPPESILSGQIFSGGVFPSGSGSSLYIAEQSADRRELTFSAVDSAQGRGRVLGHFLVDPSTGYALGISPDGRYIGIAKQGQNVVHLLNTGNGQFHELTVTGLRGLDSLDFSADGRGIFTSSRADGKPALFYVNLTGDSHPVISMDSKAVLWGIPSRDGKHLALFVQGFDANMWALQDF